MTSNSGVRPDNRNGGVMASLPRPVHAVAADLPRVEWKRDNEGAWFCRVGDIELVVKYDIDRERWEWCVGMAEDEWIECECGLRRTRAGAMCAAEKHVERVRTVMR